MSLINEIQTKLLIIEIIKFFPDKNNNKIYINILSIYIEN